MDQLLLTTIASRMIRIGMITGESSGDHLGAGLIGALQSRNLDFQVVGICGPAMTALGAQSLFPMDSLNIVGVEGLAREFRRIVRLRKEIVNEFLQSNVDIFVGIDAPDFNLSVERRLKEKGIPALHYVSPTIWAWRGYRIRKIKKSVTKMLTIYPFESQYYQQHNIPFKYVGHPLADALSEVDFSGCRKQLGFQEGDIVVAILPGSRINEVRRLSDVFVAAAELMQRQIPELKFIAPLASVETQEEFKNALAQRNSNIDIQLVEKKSHEVMAASDVVLLASGTAALEAALIGKPVVVAYRVSNLTYFLVKLLGNTENYSILNHLGETAVIPEFIQRDATAENLASAVLRYLDDEEYRESIVRKFQEFHKVLRCNANQKAADEVIRTLNLGD